MKTCSRCSESKPLDLFPKADTCKDGYRSYCKSCNKLRLKAYHASAEGRKVHSEGCKRWSLNNRVKSRIIKKRWRDMNKEACSSMSRKWGEMNRGKLVSYCANRRAMLKQAIPSWSETGAIRELYSKASVDGFQVDHIVPLNSKYVCGLHVLDNLQLLSPLANASKGNFYWPDMPTSFYS